MTHQDDLGYRDQEAPYAGDPVAPQWASDRKSFSVPSACPACAGPAVRIVPRGLPTGTKSLWREEKPAEPELPKQVTFVCACGYPHVNRPADSTETGCGAAWKVPLA